MTIDLFEMPTPQMKKIIFLLMSVASLRCYAQQGPDLKITLEQAITLGLANRYDIQSNKYNLLVADNRITKSKREWIPDLAASGNIRYSPQIQATYIPGGFFQGVGASLVALGANSTSVYSLDLNQNIYKPGINDDIKIAKNNLEQEKQKNKQNENLIKEQIAQAYLNVMLRQLQTKIAADDEQRYMEYRDVAEGKMKLGSLIENDFLKARLDYENAKVESQKARQNYNLALQNVKYQINVPEETQIMLLDSLSSAELFFNQLPTTFDISNRAEFEQLKLQQDNNRLQISRNRRNALPSVSLYANYSKQYLNTNFDYSIGKWWSPFSYVGIRFSVPITSNFKNQNTIQESQMREIQTDLQLKQKQADINYEVQKSYTDLTNSSENMKMAKSNYELSRVIYQNQRQQYGLGALLYTDLLETDRSLNTTEQNYIRSVYDYLVASINYQKAIGNY
jgi:outer membrane protein